MDQDPAVPTGAGSDSCRSNFSEPELLRRWIENRDQQAAGELYERYLNRLLRQAGDRRSEPKYVEDSVYVSAFGSFLRRASTIEFYFDHDDWLWRLLATIAKRKHLARLRKKKEQTGGGALDDLQAFVEGEPTADEIAAYNEARARHWANLKPKEQTYLEMREQGFRQKEIAEALKVDPRQVRWISKAVELKAARLFGLKGEVFGEEEVN